MPDLIDAFLIVTGGQNGLNLVSQKEYIYKQVQDILEKGVPNRNVTIVKNKPHTPPQNEKPMTIMWYATSEKTTTHVAAYYRGERIDFFPEAAASNERESDDLLGLGAALLNHNVPRKYLSESMVPSDLQNGIKCYNIYPSQLGIDPDKLLKACKDVKNDNSPYNLYSNNCADQIRKVFGKCGIGNKYTKNDEIPITLPADIKNFASQNGYQIDPRDAPLTNTPQEVETCLNWLENPEKMRDKYKKEIQDCNIPGIADHLKEMCNQFYDNYCNTAQKHPEKIAKEIQCLILENRANGLSDKLIQERINHAPERVKKILRQNKILDEENRISQTFPNPLLRNFLGRQRASNPENLIASTEYFDKYLDKNKTTTPPHEENINIGIPPKERC